MTINGKNKYLSDKLSCLCRPLKGLDNRQVIQIACGDHHSMALTNGIHSYFICHFAFIFWHLMTDMNWLRFECRCSELLLFQMVRCSCGVRTLMVSWVWGKIIPALRLLNMFRVWVGSRWLRSALEETTALCCLSLESCLDGERTLLDSWASETLQVWLFLHVKAKSVTVWN